MIFLLPKQCWGNADIVMVGGTSWSDFVFPCATLGRKGTCENKVLFSLFSGIFLLFRLEHNTEQTQKRSVHSTAAEVSVWHEGHKHKTTVMPTSVYCTEFCQPSSTWSQHNDVSRHCSDSGDDEPDSWVWQPACFVCRKGTKCWCLASKKPFFLKNTVFVGKGYNTANSSPNFATSFAASDWLLVSGR